MISKPQKIAVVGFGYWGQKLAAASIAAGLQVVIVDSVIQSQTVYLQMSWQAVLTDTEVFGVIIATPEKTHAELTHMALQANKAVLVEKPAATTSESWQACVGLAMKSNLPLLVDYTFLHSQAFEQWRTLERVYAFDLGALKQLSTTRKSQLTTERIRGKALPIWWDVVIHDLYLLRALYDLNPINWRLENESQPTHIKARASFGDAQLITDYSWLANNAERSWVAEYEYGKLLWRRVSEGEYFEVVLGKKTVFSTTIADQNPSPLDTLVKKWRLLWNRKNLAKLQKNHWDEVAHDIEVLTEIAKKLTDQIAIH